MTHIKTILVCAIASLFVASTVYALENLTEDDLAQATGQDGVTIAFILPTEGWSADQVVLTDKTGIPDAIKPGYEFNSGSILARNVGINACPETSINGGCNPPFQLYGWQAIFDAVGDADGNGISDDPMLNIQVKLNGGKLRIYLDKIAIRNGLGGNESTIIDFNHPDSVNGKDYFDLLPSDGNLFTLQLGNESSGHMFSFGTTVFNTIDFGEVRITDKTDTGVGVGGNGRNLRFNLRLDNINLTGAGLDVGSTGLVFTAPSLTNMNVTFGNISAGTSTTNMGTIGIQGLNLSKHALIISGKS